MLNRIMYKKENKFKSHKIFRIKLEQMNNNRLFNYKKINKKIDLLNLQEKFLQYIKKNKVL